MLLYNSATHEREEFVPVVPGKVGMYTCGPTVYHFAHIGNLRTYIMEDILDRYLRYRGYEVQRVMNITDVGHLTSDGDSGEDKMLKGARREHKSVMQIAAYYTDCFFSDCEKLNIRRPDVVEPATHCIPEFIHMIEVLLEKGYAYRAGGNVYFDTSKLKKYYIFNDHDAEDLGERLDLHCGGIDNAFPHHTNEIAQSEAYLGHKWCNYWMHVMHLNTEGGKMSKSKGEFLTVSLLEQKGYHPLAYRLFCLQSHYRRSQLFSFANLDNAQRSYDKLVARVAALSPVTGQSPDETVLAALRARFCEALDNDLNTALAVTALYDTLKADADDTTKEAAIAEFDTVLELGLIKAARALRERAAEKAKAAGNAGERVYSEDPEIRRIEEAIDARAAAKKAKNYAEADRIRAELSAMGITLTDTSTGTTWSR